MTPLPFHAFLLYVLVLTNEVLSLGNVIVRDLDPNETKLPERSLKAAKRSHELGPRDVKGCLRYDHNLDYLDGKFKHSLSFIITDICPIS